MVGATLLGRFILERTLGGDADWGLHLAREGERAVLISTTAPHLDGIDALARRFAAEDPVLAVGRHEHEGRPVDVLAEVCPEGRASTSVSLAPDAAARLLPAAAARVMALHARGHVIGSLRPELIFVDDGGGLSGVAPYSELFFRGIAPQSTPIRYPFDELYLAPELVRGEAATPAADVFCLAACWLRWRLGRYPIAGESFIDRCVSLTLGRFVDEAGALETPAVIRRALDADPARRPSLDELARGAS